jgi:hypothetical protein
LMIRKYFYLKKAMRIIRARKDMDKEVKRTVDRMVMDRLKNQLKKY